MAAKGSGDNGLNSPRWQQVFTELHKLSTGYEVLGNKLVAAVESINARATQHEEEMRALAQALGEVQKSRQINWTFVGAVIFGGTSFLATILFGLMAYVQLMTRDIVRAEAGMNGARIAAVDNRLGSYIAHNDASTAEIETQFRGIGQVMNLYRAEQLRMNCMLWQRAYGTQCPEYQYWPDFGNGTGLSARGQQSK